ncbi:hypothetical protein ACK8HH_02290 [Gordonia sp. LUNF6]|uniref:hypothetical protein n=1 Tax=Gordonia TaxID=2053 RepID=UPI0005ED97E0|nr:MULTISPECIES: hypothetical protein [Gordonia]KJR09031.1 hypothetical protein UG54_05675 [Gordonia sihwensis]KXT58474.1 hypothetical protein Y710_02850 [Gordonia sp. QH-12]
MPVRPRDRARALLADAPDGMDAHEVADALGVHVTTARFHLNNLVDEGSAVTETTEPRGVGRPRVVYRIVPAPSADELVHLLLRRIGETEAERERVAAETGRLWARGRRGADIDAVAVPDPVTVVEAMLTRLGFRVTDALSAFGEHQLSVCGCPLQSIASRNPEIAHGIVRGAVEFALEQASPALGGAYAVDVSPDSAGDCELVLRLSGVHTPAVRTP